MIQRFLYIISGGNIKFNNIRNILFKDNKPNPKLFAYLLYQDGIHDKLITKSKAANFITSLGVSHLKSINDIEKLEKSILFNIYKLLRIYTLHFDNPNYVEKLNFSIAINNKSIDKTKKTLYDTTGNRKLLKNIKDNIVINSNLQISDNPEALQIQENDFIIDKYSTEINEKSYYLTKILDGSTTNIPEININKNKINISETILIPSIFFYPEQNCSLAEAEFFWSYDDKNNLYSTLEIIICNQDKKMEIYTFARINYPKYEFQTEPLFNKAVSLKRKIQDKEISISCIPLPFGLTKGVSKYIYANNFLGRQLKNLGDLSMAYEASMKGLNFYTQDLISASYYILFNFYKFIYIYENDIIDNVLDSIDIQYNGEKDFLDIKNYLLGNLMLFNTD